jgi:hypothetical protein
VSDLPEEVMMSLSKASLDGPSSRKSPTSSDLHHGAVLKGVTSHTSPSLIVAAHDSI